MATDSVSNPELFEKLVQIIAAGNLGKTLEDLLESLANFGEDEVVKWIEAGSPQEQEALINLAKQYVRDWRRSKKEQADEF